MALIHPLFAILAILACLWAFIIGAKHFLAVRKGRRTTFNRTKHMQIGATGIIMLLLSAVGGGVMADLLEIDMGIYHSAGGLATIVLACAGGASGWLLYKGAALQIAAHRASVKTAHATASIFLMLLCLNQLITGVLSFLH